MSETRKIAAILVSDVVGYSRLAGADEERILARLRALRSDLIDPTISVHHGRIVKRTGDGSIIEFNSVVDAVRCAIEVQRAMVERNAGVAPDNRIAVSHRHSSWRHRRGERRRSDGRRRQYCGSVGRSLRARRRLSLRRRPPAGARPPQGEFRRPRRETAQEHRAAGAGLCAARGGNRWVQGPGPRATRARALRGGGRWIGVIAACVAALLAVGAFAWRARLRAAFHGRFG